MNRIGDRRFLEDWQSLRAASQPAPEATMWRIGQVTWQRHRTSLLNPGFSMVQEVYQLEHSGTGAHWCVLVVSETWWGPGKRVLRSQLWASHVSGSKLAAQQWLRDEMKRKEHGQANLH